MGGGDAPSSTTGKPKLKCSRRGCWHAFFQWLDVSATPSFVCASTTGTMKVYLASYADLDFDLFPNSFPELHYRKWVHTIIEQSRHQEKNGDAEISQRWFVDKWNQKVYKAHRGLKEHPDVSWSRSYSAGNNGFDAFAQHRGFRGVGEFEVVEMDLSDRYNQYNQKQVFNSFLHYFHPSDESYYKSKSLADWEKFCLRVINELEFNLSEIEKYDRNLFQILNAFPTASRHNDHNRLFNSYVQMSKEVRKAARLRGKPIIEIDVVNSHPTIIGCSKPTRFTRALARPKSWGDENLSYTSLHKRLVSRLPIASLPTNFIQTPPLPKHPPSHLSKSIENGDDVYEKMTDAISDVYARSSRSNTKTLVNKLINQRLDDWLTFQKPGEQSTFIDPKRLTTIERWAELYPEGTSLMASLPKNNVVAEMEAEMVIDMAYKRLAERSFPVIPTHDGIATTPSHEDAVDAEVKRAYEEYLGVIPETTVE